MTSNLFVWIAMLCVSASSAAASLPNIVLIMTDDQRYSDVGVFGATPYLYGWPCTSPGEPVCGRVVVAGC